MRANQTDPWYFEVLKRKAKPSFLQRIGLTKAFLNRKKKDKFSLLNFVRYVVRHWR